MVFLTHFAQQILHSICEYSQTGGMKKPVLASKGHCKTVKQKMLNNPNWISNVTKAPK